MQQKNNNQQSKWRRFSRASYASFQSVRQAFRIGVLSVAMLTTADLKATALSTRGGTADGASHRPVAVAEGDTLTVDLEDVEVLATRVPLTAAQTPRLVTVLTAADLAAAAVHSVNDLLDMAVGIDVRQRGPLGVQTDISVRGGTYDQISLLLNGVSISSPHTGHHSADFPLSPDDIERIEVVGSSSARVFGTAAFTGVVNIVTRHDADEGSVALSGGDFGYADVHARVAKRQILGRTSPSGAAARQAASTPVALTHRLSGGFSRADGATPHSSFRSTRAFYQGDLRWGAEDQPSVLDLQIGYSYKPFDANTFYGAASTDQWESNERYMAALSLRTQTGALHLAPAVAWNRWFDHYQWHHGSPVGENFHQVDTYTASLNTWVESRHGRTSLGIEMRNEGIWSTGLGRLLDPRDQRPTRGHDATDSVRYTHGDNRTNISAFLEHNVLLRRWTLSAGLLANMNTGLDHRWRFYPGLDVAFRPSRAWSLYASWSMALRMPTFTDLYYSGVGIEGDATLTPERTNDLTLGARLRTAGWRLEASAFYSHKSDMIDWVVYADETWRDEGGVPVPVPEAEWIYRSGNFTLDALGVELSTAWYPLERAAASTSASRGPALRKVGLRYAYLDERIDHGPRPLLRSKYAMEYLRHKIALEADVRLWHRLSLAASWRWQERVGRGNAPYGLVDARLAWNGGAWALYIDGSNLLDKRYYDYNIVPQPGRWLKAGASWRFAL